MNCKLAWNIFLVYITFLAPVKLLIAGKPSQGDVSRGAEKQARAKTKLPFPGLFPHHHHPVSFNCQNRKTGQNRHKQAKTGRDSSAKTEKLPFQGLFPQYHLDWSHRYPSSNKFLHHTSSKLAACLFLLIYFTNQGWWCQRNCCAL